jgi:hypothetical protein
VGGLLEYVFVASQYYVSVCYAFVSKTFPVQNIYAILLCAQGKSSQIPNKTIFRIFVSVMWAVVIHGDTVDCMAYASLSQNSWYRGADNSLARTGKKQATATEECFIYTIYNHNLRNIGTIYIYNKTSIKRNILTIKQNTSGSRSG